MVGSMVFELFLSMSDGPRFPCGFLQVTGRLAIWDSVEDDPDRPFNSTSAPIVAGEMIFLVGSAG